MAKHWTESGHAPPQECPVCEIAVSPPDEDLHAACPQCHMPLRLLQVLYDGPLPFVVRPAIKPKLQATNASQAIEELTAALEDARAIDAEHTASIVEAIKRREAMSTTGIGAGVAIPHAVHRSVRRVTATIGYSATGVAFESLDEQPAHVILLLIAPIDDPDAKAIALERISRRIQGFDFSVAGASVRSDES